MNPPDTQLKDVLGRMADEAPEPVAFEDLGAFQLQPDTQSGAWTRRPMSVLVVAAISVLLIGGVSTLVFRSDTPPGVTPTLDGRTYYESLDLSSPQSAVEVFTDAFAADDFMTVWLTLDSGAQLEVLNALRTGDYGQLVDLARLTPEEPGRYLPMPSDMETTDTWWLFDFLMLKADADDAFLIDLSGSVTIASENTIQGGDEITADVEGIAGPVTFRLIESPNGKWRVFQVLVPGGDPEAVPWSAGSGEELLIPDAPAAGAIVDLPAEHAAAQILATSPTYSEFAELANLQDREFLCGAGGGTTPWEVCLMLDDGLLAVVPFATTPGLIGTIESPDLEGAVAVPLDDGAVGVGGIELAVTLTITLQGEEVGSVSGP